jgi:hypothetical protein
MTKKTTLNEIGDMLRHVVTIIGRMEETMTAKEDIADLRRELKGDIAGVHTQVTSMDRQLRETRTEIRLSDLEEKVFGEPRR